MIHQREEHTSRIRRRGTQATLHGSDLAQPIAGIDDNGDAVRLAQTGANAVRFGAQHGDDGIAIGGEEPDQAIQKCLSAKLQQGFWKTHTARFTGGQNQAGYIHFNRCARIDSSSETDLESDRQFDVALRRTAIISAATETAISSGEMAPISSPMGAKMRSNCA